MKCRGKVISAALPLSDSSCRLNTTKRHAPLYDEG
jgi:hypothetical protein